MGFFGNVKGSIISDYFKLLEDVAAFKANNMCEIALYEDHLEIKSPFVKQEVRLKYEQIDDVFYGARSEVTVRNKSVIGRALVGGVLFGGVGAIVGAASGAGKKMQRDNRTYFLIHYTNANKQEKILQFEDSRKYKGKKLAVQLKGLCGLSDDSKEAILDL